MQRNNWLAAAAVAAILALVSGLAVGTSTVRAAPAGEEKCGVLQRGVRVSFWTGNDWLFKSVEAGAEVQHAAPPWEGSWAREWRQIRSGPWAGWIVGARDLFECSGKLEPSVVGNMAGSGCPTIIGVGLLHGPPQDTLKVGNVIVPNYVWVAVTKVNTDWVYFLAEGRELRVPEDWIPRENTYLLGVAP